MKQLLLFILPINAKTICASNADCNFGMVCFQDQCQSNSSDREIIVCKDNEFCDSSNRYTLDNNHVGSFKNNKGSTRPNSENPHSETKDSNQRELRNTFFTESEQETNHFFGIVPILGVSIAGAVLFGALVFALKLVVTAGNKSQYPSSMKKLFGIKRGGEEDNSSYASTSSWLSDTPSTITWMMPSAIVNDIENTYPADLAGYSNSNLNKDRALNDLL